MTVSGFESKAMVHLDKSSEFSFEAGSHDGTWGGNINSCPNGPHQVEAVMHGPTTIDGISSFSIVAGYGEIIHGCRKWHNRHKVFQIFETLQPTWMQASPALLKGILSEIHHNNLDVRQGQIRFIRPASGRISREDSDALEEIFGCAVIEAYGTTETGKIACNPFPPERRKPGTVGLPLDCDIAIRGNSIGADNSARHLLAAD